MKVEFRLLIPCTFGLAIVKGAGDDNICSNCDKALRKKFAVQFPDGHYGIICPACHRKYRNRREFLISDVDLFFKKDGKEVVTPTRSFFAMLEVTGFTESVVEYFNKNGYITQRQYDAAIAISQENFNEAEKDR